MRLSIRAFGLTIFEIETTPDTEHDDDNYESSGDCTTYPVGFTARPELPDEVGLPDRDW